MTIRENLQKLGLKTKEIDIYLLLIELGTQPSGVLAKKSAYPKSTVLFICQNLVDKGIIRKTNKGQVLYFHASTEDLHQAIRQEIESKQQALEQSLPILKELHNPYSSQPQVTFYEGKDGCRRAYSQLLDSETEILEFGIHQDLTKTLGNNFMNNFITERTKRDLFLRSISNENDIDKVLKKLDKVQCREQKFFATSKGKTYSSIAIFESKVLLLNLHHDSFGILIENAEVSETLKTIFELLWEQL